MGNQVENAQSFHPPGLRNNNNTFSAGANAEPCATPEIHIFSCFFKYFKSFWEIIIVRINVLSFDEVYCCSSDYKRIESSLGDGAVGNTVPNDEYFGVSFSFVTMLQ